MATTNSLKKKQQQLRANQDLLAERWTEVLAAEEHELERPSKSYPKRKLLPRLEEEAYKPTSPEHNAADRPPRGRDREASRPSTRTVPRHRSKSTRPQGNAPNLRDILEDKARQSRSIYGSRGRPMIHDDNRRAGHVVIEAWFRGYRGSPGLGGVRVAGLYLQPNSRTMKIQD